MAVKKKPTPKKVVKKAAAPKPAAKKVVAKKPAAKAKPVAKKAAPKKPAAKPVAKKPAAKPVAKPVASKPAPAKAPAKKVAVAAAKTPAKPFVKSTTHASRPAAKVVTKPTPPAAKPAAPAPKPAEVAPKKATGPAALVSIKPKVQPITKKEPPKPAKVVIPKTSTKSSVRYEPDFTKSILDANRQEPVIAGPSQRYSDSDLAEFKEIILRKLDAAKKELNYLQGLITRKDEGGDMDDARYMTMEDGSVSMEREQLSQMASRQITFIDHLEKALMRIENKTYGICRVTGKLIDKARLRAVPHATLSIEAKQMMNK
ncbi:MAG: TraR/DksA family transcriptional regulator [Chitinophagaceae bacterium]|nr:TraR/DksA family transcriptional regulator [Chitinophagaceae bacterium]NDE77853.1 TraR/DksA family transcriptional regulator [Chitinophagaceae bacterium]